MLIIPRVRGVIDRRILVNYRVKPDVLTRLLPSPFRPFVYRGVGLAGICLIRLKQMRPGFLPAMTGLASENAAHRIAVEWDEHGTTKTGVYIPRRDTSSRLNSLLGGRVFPGLQHHARFDVQETDRNYRIEVTSDDDETHLLVNGSLSQELTSNSIFESVEQASQFFEQGSVGYSITSRPHQFEGIELHSFDWSIQALAVSNVRSSFFENRMLFPQGSIEFDSALLMRGIEHEWRGQKNVYACPACVN